MKTRTAHFDGLPLLKIKLRKYAWIYSVLSTPNLMPLISSLCYRINTTNTTIFLSNISKLKHNQITRIQTQKHSFKINQIITIKAKKKKKEKKRQRIEASWPIWTGLGTKMSNSTKMRAPWNVLEWGRKGKFSNHRESFGIK